MSVAMRPSHMCVRTRCPAAADPHQGLRGDPGKAARHGQQHHRCPGQAPGYALCLGRNNVPVQALAAYCAPLPHSANSPPPCLPSPRPPAPDLHYDVEYINGAMWGVPAAAEPAAPAAAAAGVRPPLGFHVSCVSPATSCPGPGPACFFFFFPSTAANLDATRPCRAVCVRACLACCCCSPASWRCSRCTL